MRRQPTTEWRTSYDTTKIKVLATLILVQSWHMCTYVSWRTIRSKTQIYKSGLEDVWEQRRKPQNRMTKTETTTMILTSPTPRTWHELSGPPGSGLLTSSVLWQDFYPKAASTLSLSSAATITTLLQS